MDTHVIVPSGVTTYSHQAYQPQPGSSVWGKFSLFELAEEGNWKVNNGVSVYHRPIHLSFDERTLTPLLPPLWQPFAARPLDAGLYKIDKAQLCRFRADSEPILNQNTTQKPTHFGTLLYYPPADLFCPGGFDSADLHVLTGENVQTIRPSAFDSWTVVGIKTGVAYRHYPPTRGCCYVFVVELHVNPLLLETLSTTSAELVIHPDNYHAAVDDEIALFDRVIRRTQAEIDALQEKMTALRRRQEKVRSWHAIILQQKVEFPGLEHLVTDVAENWMGETSYVILEHKYPDGVQPSELLGQDALIYSRLQKNLPKVQLVTRYFQLHYFSLDARKVDPTVPRENTVIKVGQLPLLALEWVEVSPFASSSSYNSKITRLFFQGQELDRHGEGQLWSGYKNEIFTPVWRGWCTAICISRE